MARGQLLEDEELVLLEPGVIARSRRRLRWERGAVRVLPGRHRILADELGLYRPEVGVVACSQCRSGREVVSGLLAGRDRLLNRALTREVERQDERLVACSESGNRRERKRLG